MTQLLLGSRGFPSFPWPLADSSKEDVLSWKDFYNELGQRRDVGVQPEDIPLRNVHRLLRD